MAALSGRERLFACALLLLGFAAEINAAVVPIPIQGQVLGSPAPSPISSIECGSACAARQNLCRRACGSCCARCDCVPPGTSGNKDKCPCYANITTQVPVTTT